MHAVLRWINTALLARLQVGQSRQMPLMTQRQSCCGTGTCTTPRCWARLSGRLRWSAASALHRWTLGSPNGPSSHHKTLILLHAPAVQRTLITPDTFGLGSAIWKCRSKVKRSRSCNLQGQTEMTALADACKALAQAATGKAAAKRAGRALEKVLKESSAATPATVPPPAATPAAATPAAQPGGAAAAGGPVTAASPVPLSLTPAGSPVNVRSRPESDL